MAGAWAPLQASHTMQGTPSSYCLRQSVNCPGPGEHSMGKGRLLRPHYLQNKKHHYPAAHEEQVNGRAMFFSSGAGWWLGSMVEGNPQSERSLQACHHGKIILSTIEEQFDFFYNTESIRLITQSRTSSQ